MHDSWADILVRSFREVALRLAGYAPRVLAVLTLVLAGGVVAAGGPRLPVGSVRGPRFDGRPTLARALAFGFGGRHIARRALEGWLRRQDEHGPDDVSHL